MCLIIIAESSISVPIQSPAVCPFMVITENNKQAKFLQQTEKNILPTEGTLFLIKAMKPIINTYVFFPDKRQSDRELIKVY